ncbi:MAG TPA: hypothetical protein VII89_00010 [Candidatus Dormibacteraeota bacterium]
MRRVLALGCLVPVGFFVVSLAIIGAWQAFESSFNPAVAAIREHPVQATGRVEEVVIDGFGGDPAVDYTYIVAGRTFHGHDVGSSATGNVLEKNPGDPIPIQFAATIPSVSCVAGSEDCPNDVFAPGVAAYLFWALVILSAVGAGLYFLIRAAIRGLRHRSAAPKSQ